MPFQDCWSPPDTTVAPEDQDGDTLCFFLVFLLQNSWLFYCLLRRISFFYEVASVREVNGWNIHPARAIAQNLQKPSDRLEPLTASPARHLLRRHPSIRYLLYPGEVDALEGRALFPTSIVHPLISPHSLGFAHLFLECQIGQLRWNECPFLSLLPS